MATSDMEKMAKEAFVDDDFDRAVDLYSQAIDSDPTNAGLYADRAQANIKLENYTEAVADANKAIELNPSMPKAYMRKGTACFKLEEYQTAKTALIAGSALAPGDSRFTKLIKECDEFIAEETGALTTIQTLPSLTLLPVSTSHTEGTSSSQSTAEVNIQTKEVAKQLKYRHDYYNTPTEVVLSIFVKRVAAQNVSIDFGEQILSVEIDIPGEEKYHFQPRLYGKIIPDKSKYAVLSSKIEIRLSKAETISWPSLEHSGKEIIPQKISTSSAGKSQRPSYPSSKSKIDWDKLEAEVKKEEKEEKLDGDAALNKIFRNIYSDADDDMRRAMSKSFVESNGTVLSTNWKDVGSKKVEGSAPDGMEMNKWEY